MGRITDVMPGANNLAITLDLQRPRALITALIQKLCRLGIEFVRRRQPPSGKVYRLADKNIHLFLELTATVVY